MVVPDKIIEYIVQHGPTTPKQLVDSLGISRSTILRRLSYLIANGQLLKTGNPPWVLYCINQKPAPPQAGQTQPVKTVKAAPNQIQPLGQELLPNWCQKFNIDPTVVTTRYESVRGFVPGLSPRGRNSAKKKLLAALYSGIVLALVFLSVWATGSGSKRMRWVKIGGLILIAGIIYVVIFHGHRFVPHQNQSNQLETQLIASQDETAKLKDQLTDSQSHDQSHHRRDQGQSGREESQRLFNEYGGFVTLNKEFITSKCLI